MRSETAARQHKVLLEHSIGAADAADRTIHSYRATLASKFATARANGNPQITDGVIQMHERWKTASAMRSYVHVAPADFADNIDLALRTDAGAIVHGAIPEIEPTRTLEEVEDTVQHLDARSSESGPRGFGNSIITTTASTASTSAPVATPPSAPHGRRHVGPGSRSTSKAPKVPPPQPPTVCIIGQPSPVRIVNSDTWGLLHANVSLSNELWGENDGASTDCVVKHFLGKFQFDKGGKHPAYAVAFLGHDDLYAVRADYIARTFAITQRARLRAPPSAPPSPPPCDLRDAPRRAFANAPARVSPSVSKTDPLGIRWPPAPTASHTGKAAAVAIMLSDDSSMRNMTWHQRWLVELRPEGKPFAGLYGAVGGKVEPSESHEQAAIREVAEEVGACVTPHSLSLLCATDVDGRLVYSYQADWSGPAPHGREGQQIFWITASQALGWGATCFTPATWQAFVTMAASSPPPGAPPPSPPTSPAGGDTYGTRRKGKASNWGRSDKASRERARKGQLDKRRRAFERNAWAQRHPQECPVCMDEEKTHLLYSCAMDTMPFHRGHGLCSDCATRIINEGRACPLCNLPVENAMPVGTAFFVEA